MKTAFEQRLRQVRRKRMGNLLLEELAWALTLAGLAAALLVAVERAFALGIYRPWAIGTLAGAGAAAAAALWYRRRPSLLAIAIQIDRDLGLKERMSTTLALSQLEDPFAVAAREQAHQAAEEISLQGRYPVRPTRRWLWTGAAWALAAAAALFLPPLDLLGRDRSRSAQKEEERQLAQARADVKEAIAKVEVKVQQLPEKGLAADLAKASEAKDALKPEDVRNQAIRKLGDLSDKIKQMESSPKMEATKNLKDMLKGIHPPSQSAMPKLNQDIAKGDFAAAAQKINDLKKQLEDGKVSPEEKQALAKQLSELGKQLEEMAGRNGELKNELGEAGLSKELADLGEQQFKDEVEKQGKEKGLSQEQIDEILEKADACRKACEQAKKLGKCMEGCMPGPDLGQMLTPDELAQLLDQLGEMDGECEGLAAVEGSLDEIERAIALLGGNCPSGNPGLGLSGSGQGLGQGQGQGQGPFAQGDPAGKQGRGTGGPGIGQGARASDNSGDTGTEKTKVDGPKKEGPIVASWLYKGPQVTGESKKQLQDVIKASRDAAAEAINENEIPGKYKDPVMKYFGGLEEATTRPAP